MVSARSTLDEVGSGLQIGNSPNFEEKNVSSERSSSEITTCGFGNTFFFRFDEQGKGRGSFSSIWKEI